MSSLSSLPSYTPPHTRLEVGLLGCTGIVGQKFIQLLENHTWFILKYIAASERSAGKTYEVNNKLTYTKNEKRDIN